LVEKEEYAESPVPQHARLGFASPALIWAGFAYAYICIFIGSQIMAGLGAPLAYVAIIGGQIFLFVYSGLIAHHGSKFGLNFAMMCKSAFGKYGYAIPTLIIAGLVAGWFAFQAWLAADLMVGLYGGESFNAGTGSGLLPGILGTTGFWAGVFAIMFGLFAVYGIKAMAWMGKFAVVSVTILALWMIYSILSVVAGGTGGNPLVSSVVGEPWTFALGFTASIGTFIVSSTMTSDFTRWTKTPRQAWAVTAVAFPICNFLMLMVGAIFTSVSGKLDFFFGLGALALGIPIMIIQWASNGSTCDGCLYNAVQGFKNVSYHITKGKINFSWKKISIIVMIAGTVVAASNILNSIVPWLQLLGTVVSLVGGILIGHFWIVARKSNQAQILASAERKVNVPAIIGLLAGIAIAAPIVAFVPDIPSVIGGLIGGVIVYPLAVKLERHYYKNKKIPSGIAEDSPLYNDNISSSSSSITDDGNSNSSGGSSVSQPNALDSQHKQDDSGFKDVALKSSKGAAERGGVEGGEGGFS
jgi:cytosine permease